jgi:hypothetical protein
LAGLDALGFRRHPKALQEVVRAFADRPDYVRGWLQELQTHRAQYANPAGFFRKPVLREGTPLPMKRPSARCPRCKGAGYVLENNHATPCPTCHAPDETDNPQGGGRG